MIVFSWQMAEELAAAHMRNLGFERVRRLPDGIDGGIDVTAEGAAAQVKHHAVAIGSPDVQRLRGAAPHAQALLFYSSSGYTRAAKDAADLAGISLFRYTTSNEVLAENGLAAGLVQRPEGDSLLAAIFDAMRAGARAGILHDWVNRTMQKNWAKSTRITSGEITPNMKEINRLTAFLGTVPAVAAAMEDVARAITDPLRIEAIASSDVDGIKVSAEKLQQATEVLLSLVTIDAKAASSLNSALQRKLESKDYATLRDAGETLGTFAESRST